MKRFLLFVFFLFPLALFGATTGNLRTFPSLNSVLASNPTLIGPHVVTESYWLGVGKGGIELVWNSTDATDTNTFQFFKSQSTDWTSPNGRWRAVPSGNNFDITTGGVRGDWPTTADDATTINLMVATLALNGVPANIIMPVGVYGDPGGILVGKNNGASYSTVNGIHFIGDVKTASGEPGQVKIVVTDGLAAGILMQNCADCSVENINFVGMNSFFGEAKVDENNFAGTFLDIENFKSSVNTVSTNRYAPHVGIAIDPFSSTTPTQYPGLAANYVGTGGSSENINILNCTFTDFVAPWVVTPADSGGGVHHFLAENCKTLQSTYGAGFGTSLVDFRIKNHQWRDVFTIFSTDDFGNQTGTIPNAEGHAKFATYLFQKALTNITTGIDIEYQNIQAKVVGGAGPEVNGRLMIAGSLYDGSGTHALHDDGTYKTVSGGAGLLSGIGTVNIFPIWTTTNTLGNSKLQQSGINLIYTNSANLQPRFEVMGSNGANIKLGPDGSGNSIITASNSKLYTGGNLGVGAVPRSGLTLDVSFTMGFVIGNQLLNADNQIIGLSSALLAVTSDDPVPSNRTFHIGGSPTRGSVHTLFVTTNAVQLLNNDPVLVSSGFVLLNGDWNGTQNQCLQLMYDGTNYIETGRSPPASGGSGGDTIWTNNAVGIVSPINPTNYMSVSWGQVDGSPSDTDNFDNVPFGHSYPFNVSGYLPTTSSGNKGYKAVFYQSSTIQGAANFSDLVGIWASGNNVQNYTGVITDNYEMRIDTNLAGQANTGLAIADFGSGANDYAIFTEGGKISFSGYATLFPEIADDGTSVPYIWDTPARSNLGAPQFSVKNGTTNVMTVRPDGLVKITQPGSSKALSLAMASGVGSVSSDDTLNLGAGGETVILAAGVLQSVNPILLDNVSGIAWNGLTNTVTDTRGYGTPEGVLSRAVGSTYRRYDGGFGTTFYVKTNGASSTGWGAVVGSAGTGDALVANPLSQFAATTSAQLKGVLSDENGGASGKVIFAEGTLTLASGKTLTANNTLTLAGTDGTTQTFPTTTATIARTDAAQTFTGTQSFGIVNHSGLDTVTLAGVAATPTDGLSLVGSDVATVGAQKYSPALHFTGSGWRTTATAAAQAVDYRVYLQPVQGAANPTANINFDYSVNGGAFATQAALGSAGQFLAGNGILASPGFAFLNFPGTGIYETFSGAVINGAANGSACFTATPGAFNVTSTSGHYQINGDVGILRNVAGVASLTDGTTARAGWNLQWQGQSRVSTQYDQTTTTLGAITGLTSTVKAGRTYKFVAHLDCTLDVTGGGKYAMGGTATATSISYRVRHVGASLAMLSSARQTALASAVNSAASLTDDDVEIIGLITVNAGGTLTAQFAQQAAGGTSSVLVGSWLEIMDVQ